MTFVVPLRIFLNCIPRDEHSSFYDFPVLVGRMKELMGSKTYHWEIWNHFPKLEALNQTIMKKRYLFFTLILCLSFVESKSQTLKAYYPFSGNGGDSSGNSYNATVNGATLTTDRFGRANHAYSLNGTSNSISFTNVAFKTTFYSYSIWFKIDAIPAKYACLLNIGTSTTGQAMMINDTLNNMGFGMNATNTDLTKLAFPSAGHLPEINRWYHLVVTRDGTSMNFYVDGLLFNSLPTNGTAPSYGSSGFKCSIGVLGTKYYFAGTVDDVRIYDYALGGPEVTALHKSESPADKLIAYYKFSGDAKDSVNGYVGTITDADTAVDRFGRAAHAYKFNGTTAKIDISSELYKQNKYTYSAWVNVAALPGNGQYSSILNLGDDREYQGLQVANDINTGNIGMKVKTWATDSMEVSIASTGIPITLNKWYNVVVTHDDNLINFYVDATLINSNLAAGKRPAFGADYKALIGTNYAGTQYFNGSIDDIRIYNYAMNLTQVKALNTYEKIAPPIDTTTHIGIADRFRKDVQISIYPNPSNGNFNVFTSDVSTHLQLDIYTIAGSLVKTVSILNQETAVENLETGMFILRFRNNEGTVKVLKATVGN